MNENGELKIYKSKSGEVKLIARIENETIWLTQQQMGDLFDVNQPAIAKHLSNIFKTKELNENSVHSILEYTAKDNKSYKTKFYNLDAIISVGYRVNSKRATDFRVWATKTLRSYIVKGYAINEKRLIENGRNFEQAQKLMNFIMGKAKVKELSGHEKEILDVIERYSKTWRVLTEYDEGKINLKKPRKEKYKINYYNSRELIAELQANLLDKGLAGDLFGNEIEDKFEAILGSIYQTYGGEELYSSIEERAAHLIYFVIKDHPFSDGNKRIGSLLFLYFLEKNSFLFKKDGVVKLNDRSIVALALLVATSAPTEKDIMINLIMSLLQD